MPMKNKCVFIIIIFFLLKVNYCFAAFPLVTSNIKTIAVSEVIDNSRAKDNFNLFDEYLPGHGYSGGHGHSHGHARGHSSHGHWHGISHDRGSRSHYYRPHHTSRGYAGGGYSDIGGTHFGILSLLFCMAAPFALLIYGSISAIVVTALAAIFGLIGIFSDRSNEVSFIGLMIGALELAVLLVLYSMFII